MKTILQFIAAMVLLLVGSCAGGELFLTRTTVWRQKLTIEIDTPQGLRSGSSVTHVQMQDRTRMPWNIGNDYLTHIKGEAVFVDLGAGKQAIVLIDDLSDNKPRGTARELPATKIPQIVTFTDINNPASAKIVFGHRSQIEPDPARPGQQRTVNIPIDDIASTFGPGHAFRRATVEMMEPGIWPFNQFSSLTWPQWLFGEPLTTGIEGKLPAIMGKLIAEGKIPGQVEYPNAPYKANSGQFIRGF